MSRKKRAVYRDGVVHVLKRQCATCIFKTEEQGAAVGPERTQGMLETCIEKDTIIPCHEWMDTKTPVVCRGLYQTKAIGVLRIAEAVGAIVFDDLGDHPDFVKA